MSDKVREQYEAYPYPSRAPADHAKRLIVGSPSNPLEINHYLFAGRRDFRTPFRAQIAGRGTCHATITLAQRCPKAVRRQGIPVGGVHPASATAPPPALAAPPHGT